MSLPIQRPKPDLKRFETRVIPIAKDKDRLRSHLMPWMAEVVKSTGQPRNIRGLPAAKFLVNMANLEPILSGTTMSLGKGEPQKTVYAQFDLGGQPSGAWSVQHVSFSLHTSAFDKKSNEQKRGQEQAELKARLLAEAEEKNRSSPKAKAFKAASHVNTWIEDIKAGARLVQGDFTKVYEFAAKAASIPANPISVKDVAMGAAGKVVGKLGDMEARAGKLAKAYDKIDGMISESEKMAQYGEQIREPKPEDIFSRSQSRIYKTDKGDVIADAVIDEATKLPGAGPFVKGFAAMFFHFASMNYAGAVAKVRGRCYSWYIAGYVQGLTGMILDSPPTDELDQYFFKLGLATTLRDSDSDKFRAQIFLLWYSSEHQIIGQNAPGERRTDLDWSFPNDYLAAWSPQRLALSMATLLKTKQYLTD